MKIIECIPNFSEGRDPEVITAIADAAAAVAGVRVLNFSADCDHNRSVLTFIGAPEDVLGGAIAACDKAVELIDMRGHRGCHPRIGAVDVVPFVPLEGAQMMDAVEAAHRFGHTFAHRHDVPVYFYGEAALSKGRKRLADIRRGEYEALGEKIADPAWRPDAGPPRPNLRLGATAVGARKPLIAFNVNLDSDDLELARKIARSIRHSSGGFSHVQALGVFLESRNIVQVSMNLTDYEVTSILTVFDTIKEKVAQEGVEIVASELIGLIPRAALKGITPQQIKLTDFSEERIIESHCRGPISPGEQSSQYR